MSNYRRSSTPGATWFFTVNLYRRRENDLLVREIERLRSCVAAERARRPFTVRAWVVLPEHMHWIWTLPPGDADFATRWRLIKLAFTRGLSRIERRAPVRDARRERAIWQRRYWEHQIRDDNDLHRHIDYIHFNPVKHGYAKAAIDWPHSSFRVFVDRGMYSADWATDVHIDDVGEAGSVGDLQRQR